MYVLDTSATIEILKETKTGKKVVQAIGSNHFALSSITAFEILAGALPEEQGKTLELIDSSEIIEFDKESAKISGKIARQLNEKGETINPLDTCIAGSAIKYNAEIVTLDKDFKRIPNLKTIILKP